MKDSIYGRCLLLIWSCLLTIGVIYALIFPSGDRLFDFKTFYTLLANNYSNYNIYDKIVQMISGDNYVNLTDYEKNFYFSNSIYSLVGMIEGVKNIWVIGELIYSTLSIILVILSVAFVLIEFVLKGIVLIYVISITIFNYLGASVPFAS